MAKNKTHPDGGKETGERRYPVDKHPKYNAVYDEAVRQSPILNPEAKNIKNSYKIDNLEMGLVELVGVKDGYYQGAGSDWFLASIPKYERELQALKERFKKWQKEKIEKGEALTPPKEYPEELLHLRLKYEALLDASRRAARKYKKLIKEKKEEELKKRRGEMLPHGPLGKGGSKPHPEVRHGIWEIDGQRIAENEKGIPFIDEPESPYHEMTLFHYKKMAEKWKEDCGLTWEQLRQRRQKIYEEKIQQAHKAGKPPPATSGTVSLMKIGYWVKYIGITKDDWPEPPKDSKITELD